MIMGGGGGFPGDGGFDPRPPGGFEPNCDWCWNGCQGEEWCPRERWCMETNQIIEGDCCPECCVFLGDSSADGVVARMTTFVSNNRWWFVGGGAAVLVITGLIILTVVRRRRELDFDED